MKHAAKLVNKMNLVWKKSLTYLIKYLHISVQFCSVQCKHNKIATKFKSNSFLQLQLKKYTIGLTFRFFGELFSSKEQGFGNVELKFDKIVKAKIWVYVYACIDQLWSHLPFFVCKLLSFTLRRLYF